MNLETQIVFKDGMVSLEGGNDLVLVNRTVLQDLVDILNEQQAKNEISVENEIPAKNEFAGEVKNEFDKDKFTNSINSFMDVILEIIADTKSDDVYTTLRDAFIALNVQIGLELEGMS